MIPSASGSFLISSVSGAGKCLSWLCRRYLHSETARGIVSEPGQWLTGDEELTRTSRSTHKIENWTTEQDIQWLKCSRLVLGRSTHHPIHQHALQASRRSHPFQSLDRVCHRSPRRQRRTQQRRTPTTTTTSACAATSSAAVGGGVSGLLNDISTVGLAGTRSFLVYPPFGKHTLTVPTFDHRLDAGTYAPL